MDFDLVFDLFLRYGEEYRYVLYPAGLRPFGLTGYLSFSDANRRFGERTERLWAESLRLIARDNVSYSWAEYIAHYVVFELAQDRWIEAMDRTNLAFQQHQSPVPINIDEESSSDQDSYLDFLVDCVFLDGTTYRRTVNINCTIACLRELIAVASSVSSGDLRLSFRGRLLDDDLGNLHRALPNPLGLRLCIDVVRVVRRVFLVHSAVMVPVIYYLFEL